MKQLDIKQLKGPKTPALIQTIQWLFDPVSFLDRCYARYGDFFSNRFIFAPQGVCISDPKAIQAILSAPPGRFDSGKMNRITMPLLGERSLLVLDGTEHTRQRRLLMPPFHGERMLAYGNLMLQITQQVIQRWQVGETVAILPTMQEITLQAILKAVFGITDEVQFQVLRQRIISLFNFLSTPWNVGILFIPFLRQDLGAWSPGTQFLQRRRQIDELLYQEIDRRRQHPDPTRQDILSLMMAARDEDGQPMSNLELRDELITLLFAGHETTASSLTWALYWILRLPEVQAKLREELAQLPSDATPTTIAQLPYLNAVCQETLRLYPVTMYTFARITREPIELMGYQIEPGTLLSPCIYLTHQRPDIYPEPKRFRPERFLERQFSPYEYYPFGGGDRRCVGMAFAQYEMRLVLATILRQMQLQLLPQQSVRQASRGLAFGPSSPIFVQVKQRCES